MLLDVKDLTVCYGNTKIVEDVSFSVQEGKWLMIVGPNGAGKSTILNAITQAAPYTGTISLAGKDIRKMSARRRAQEIGVLGQNHFVGYGFTVEEVVNLGRYAYSAGMFSGKQASDEEAVAHALEVTGLSQMREQSVLTLSGGELQRTFLAQVFAQEPRVLLLDEPTNHLDLVYQKQVFELIAEWVRQPGRAVVSVVHDLSLAKAFGSDALLVHNGKRVAFGGAGEVLCPEHVNAVYQMDVGKWLREVLSKWEEA